jgi:protein required for attachment to host cells
MKRLTKQTMVLVADGARGVLYRVEGDAGHPHLKEFRRYAQEDAPTRDQGTDRPGRINDSTGRRSAVETTDWHQLSEDAFIARIASELEGDLASGDFSELVVVIPPVALGAFRKKASEKLQRSIVLELNKDLTRHPLPELTDMLKQALAEA